MVNGLDITRVLVVGGGFAGVAAAKRLAGEPGVQVTLLDREGCHQFLPLLYQVATAELTPADIRFDLADVFASHSNVEARTADVASVDPERRTVTLAGGEELAGDELVLAAGTQPNFARVPGAAEHAFPLYSVGDAERVRHRFYLRPHHRSAELLDPSTVDTPRITWKRRT